jgi:hypothetical protein
MGIEDREDVDDPEALAAWLGKAKHGEKKFAAKVKKGQKQAAKAAKSAKR